MNSSIENGLFGCVKLTNYTKEIDVHKFICLGKTEIESRVRELLLDRTSNSEKFNNENNMKKIRV